VVKLAEKRDELEKLIEKQKGKSQPENSGIPQRESPMVAPAMPAQQMPQQPMQQQNQEQQHEK